LKEKKIHYKEDITEGIEHAGEALVAVLEGKNFGKKVVKVAEPTIHKESK